LLGTRSVLTLLVAAGLQAQDPATGATPAPAPVAQPRFAFGPALYTLRATDKTGGSLVFLDETGREIPVDKDGQTAGGGGLFSSVPFHASFYGAFTAAPDLATVIYAKYGKVKAPFSFSIGGSSGTTGAGFGYQAAFGSHKLLGIHAWNRGKASSELVWDAKDLEARLKAWVKTKDGAAFQGADLDDELEANRPTYLFPLEGGRFAFFTGSSILELDPGTKAVRFLFWDGGDNNLAGGPGLSQAWSSTRGTSTGRSFGLGITEKTAAFIAWQEADGSIHALRPGLALQLSPQGILEARPLPEGFRLSALPGGLTIAAGAKGLHIASADPKATPLRVDAPSSLILPSSAGGQFFLYKHYATKNDTLSKVLAEGKVAWTADLGDCKFGMLLAESGDLVRVLVRATKTRSLVRYTLSAAEGKQLKADLWGPDAAPSSAALPAPASLALAEDALMIPVQDGFLAWCPAKGEATVSGEAWAPPSAAEVAALHQEARASGTWIHIDGELRMRTLLGRAQADQMVLLRKGRTIPLFNWINSGICLGSNPGDRNYFTAQGKSHPFFWRDFGSVVPPLASQWAQEALAAPAPAPLPTSALPVAGPGKP
jgi:hypothetical protein